MKQALESRTRIVRVKKTEWRTQNQAVVSTDFDCSSLFYPISSSDESSRSKTLELIRSFLLNSDYFYCMV
ncbi:hypothetical protein HanPI659440_Chr15g0585831 [Helianthus annuus]|nr:hypothetical protein HanPI659440_Chr15g0585831 [Helianthus annuus]